MIVISKDNEKINIGISDETNYYAIHSSDVAKSMYPIRIVSNKHGKIILACQGDDLRLEQIILEHTDLLNRKERIDYTYLVNEYVPSLKEVLSNEYYDNLKNKDGKFDMRSNIAIVTNEEAFIIYGDMYISPCESEASNDRTTAFMNVVKKSMESRGYDFIDEVFDCDDDYFNGKYPSNRYYSNNKDYKIKMINKLGRKK